jgi:radical SAM protein with 4Fe4S-binding SPASM domain
VTPLQRRLPIAPEAGPSKRRLALADESRAIDKRVRPIYAVWEITLACDLACGHCGSRAGKARPDELSTEECLDLVRQMHEMGVTEVTVIGGEAYLRDDWLDIVKDIASRGMRVSTTTGGRGMTLERARAAKAAGLRNASVSVDGLRDTHDKLRGLKGSFDSAIAAMANLKEAGIPFSANTQVNRCNLHEIPAVFDLLADAGIKAWQVQLTTAMGRAADEDELLIEPYQVLFVMPMLAALNEKAEKRGIRIWAGNNIGYFGPYESTFRGKSVAGHRGSCGAGRTTLGIEANGDIKGCPSLPTEAYVGGNIRDASLKDIWERSSELRFTRDMTVDKLSGFCRTCYYAEACLGGCNWTSHVAFGKTGDNPFCHHRALELLKNGERERLVRKTRAPGRPFDYATFEIVREPWPAGEREGAERAARGELVTAS